VLPDRDRAVALAGACAVAGALALVGCSGGSDDSGTGASSAPGGSDAATSAVTEVPSSGPVTASTGLGRPDPRVPVGAPATVLVVPLDVADPAGGWFVTADLPQLEGLADVEAEAAIDADLARSVGSLVDTWQARFEGRPRDREGGPTASLVATFEVRWFDARAISIWFDVRVADGGNRTTVALTATFDVRDGARLTLDDVLRDGDRPWPTVVSELVTTELVGRLAPDDPALADSIAAGASASASNFTWFTLGPDGLRLVFEEFQLGPGDLGTPVVVIPWADLADVIAPRGPAGTLAPPPTTTSTTTSASTTSTSAAAVTATVATLPPGG
jgi:hypothetical protein